MVQREALDHLSTLQLLRNVCHIFMKGSRKADLTYVTSLLLSGEPNFICRICIRVYLWFLPHSCTIQHAKHNLVGPQGSTSHFPGDIKYWIASQSPRPSVSYQITTPWSFYTLLTVPLHPYKIKWFNSSSSISFSFPTSLNSSPRQLGIFNKEIV